MQNKIFMNSFIHRRNAGLLLYLSIWLAAESANSQTNYLDKHPGQPKSPPEAFVMLANHLADPYKTNREERENNLTLAQTVAAYKKAVQDLLVIAATGENPQLAELAEEGADAMLDLVIQMQVIEALPKAPETDDMIMEGLLRLLLRGFGIIGRMEELYRQDTNLKRAFLRLMEVSRRLEKTKLRLPELAAQFAGPSYLVGQVLTIDFDESRAPHLPHWITLVNSSGTALHHSTVLVELRGKNSAIKQHLHFIDEWKPGSAIHGEYGAAAKTQNQTINNGTVGLVQAVKVSLWCDELSQESITYNYAGAERDKDMAQYLSRMKIVSRYRPVEKGVFFDTQRGLYMWLQEVDWLSAPQIIVHFHRGQQIQTLEWSFPSWEKDEKKILDTKVGALSWDPEWYSIEIHLPEVEYKWTNDRRIRP